MKGVFEILVKGQIEVYYDYRDIPEEFDNVIKFIPEIPPGPHTDRQHQEMEKHTELLHDLMKRETK